MNQEELKKLDKCIKDTDTALFSVGKRVLITRLLIGAVLIGGIIAKPLYPQPVQQTMNQGINYIDNLLEKVNHGLNVFGANQLHKVNPYFTKIIEENPQNTFSKNIALGVVGLEIDMRKKAENPHYQIDIEKESSNISKKIEVDQKQRLKEVQEYKKAIIAYKTKFILMAKHDKQLKNLENKDNIARVLYEKNIPIEESLKYVKENPKIVFETPSSDKEIVGYKIKNKSESYGSKFSKDLNNDMSSIINQVKDLTGLKNSFNKDENKEENKNKNKLN